MATVDEVRGIVNTATAALVAPVQVKLPPFWRDQTDLWFIQAEAQFTIKGITVESTKFAHIVTMLDSQDILQTPGDTPYTTLKNRLTGVFAITDDEKADRILDMNGLGDQTPSQCLTSMLNLVPKGENPGFLFRKVFLRQLPADVRTQLAQTTKTGTRPEDLRALALEADKYFSSMGSRISVVNQVLPVAARVGPQQQVPGQPPFPVADLSDWSRDQLVSAVLDQKLCRVHARFGKKARKCEPPCQWSGPDDRSWSTGNGRGASNPGNGRSGRGGRSN